MSVVFKTTVNSPSALAVDCIARDRFVTPAPVHSGEAASPLPIDQTLLEAIGDAMAVLAADERKEREQQISELREKAAMLGGRVDALMSLMRGKGQVIDLPPLPRSDIGDELIRKAKLS
jgi:hypothetical protein